MNTLPLYFYLSPTHDQTVIQDRMEDAVLSEAFEKASNSDDYLTQLPQELLEEILQYVPNAQLLPLANYCYGTWQYTEDRLSNLTNKEKLYIAQTVAEKENNVAINNLQAIFPGLGSVVEEVEGYSALHIAAELNSGNPAPKLLKLEGIDVNARSNSNYTALGLAVNYGNENAFDALIYAANINLNIGNGPDNNTALQIAIINDKGNLFRKLISLSQCDITIRNNNGETAQHMAARYNRIKDLRLLMQHKDFDVNCQDANVNTALIRAIKSSNTNIALCYLHIKTSISVVKT